MTLTTICFPNEKPVKISNMKGFDRHQEENLGLYNDFAYKVIHADKAVDLGLYEEKTLKNGRIKRVKATGTLKQRLIITFSRKMTEYQRTVRSHQPSRPRQRDIGNFTQAIPD